MNLLNLEPFSVGYINSERQNVEYRIASGIKSFAENIPLSLDPADVFVAPYKEYESMLFHYSRADGIEIFRDKISERCAQYPELEPHFVELLRYFTPLETSRIISKVRTPLQEKLEYNKCCWAAGGGHSNPDYEMLLRLGTNGIRSKIKKFRNIHNDRDDLYDSFEMVLDAVEIVAERYRKMAVEMLDEADGKDKKTLERLIDAFSNIPQNQPRNFFEACEMFWLFFAFMDIDSPGLFDYTLGSYYEKEDETDRYECLTALWECFKVTRSWNLCVGGSDEFGNDRTNALTYDVLKIAKEKKYDTPNLTMRVHPGTPEDLWKAAMDTLATGIGMPAIYNDECVCTALEAIGIPASDAHLYCMNGCNQIDIFGKSHMGLEDGEISVIKALELALNNGLCKHTNEVIGVETGNAADFSTFEELVDAFYTQCDFLADYVTETSYKAQQIFAEYAPNPWKSVMVQGCIEKGMDYKDRGPYYGHGQVLTEGLPDAVDSLVAIKHFVYDEKKYTMAVLLDALDKNFEGYDELYKDFSTYDKFGNDIESTDEVYSAVTDHIYRYFRTKKTFRGGFFGVGCSTFNRSHVYGRHCGAMPNGKKKYESLIADSIGATPGCDKNGPTALLNSVLKSNQYLATSGNVLQMKFPKSQFATDDGKAAFEALAKTYFKEGGQTLQINVVSKEELLKAHVNPEGYENLIVRVGGFSAYFINLPESLRENIIARTEQQM